MLEKADSQQPNLLRVLTYHRVDHPDTRPTLYPRVTVTPEAFAAQMAFLAANYHPISVLDLLDTVGNGRKATLPPRAVLVTFDDAYCDFAEQAWPIMQRHKIPVTLFVPTAFPDHPQRFFWWDRLYQALRSTPRRDTLNTPVGILPLDTAVARENALVQLRDYVKTVPHAAAMAWIEALCNDLQATLPETAVLGWNDLRLLAKQGVTLGAHTQTHPLMNRVSTQEACAEAVNSMVDLQAQIGDVPPIFAYPSGGFNDDVVQALAQEGFALAFTTDRGLNHWPASDPLRIKRLNIGSRTSLNSMRTQLLPQSKYLFRTVPGMG